MKGFFALVLSLILVAPASAQKTATHSVTIVVPRFTTIAFNPDENQGDSTSELTIYVTSNQRPGKVVLSGSVTGKDGFTLQKWHTDDGISQVTSIVTRSYPLVAGYGAGYSPGVQSATIVTVTD